MIERNILYRSAALMIIVALSVPVSTAVQAGSEDMVAGKRVKFEDNTKDTMREVLAQREAENKAFREKVLLNSEESVRLLREIKNLLEQLNKKE